MSTVNQLEACVADSTPPIQERREETGFLPLKMMIDLRMGNGVHIIVTQPKLLWSEKAGEEVGGLMLSATGMDRFYYLRNFHDFHCKNSRALSIIHRQLNRVSEKDEVFIVISKGRRKVRLFVYDNRSFSLYEQYFMPGYRFMRVSHDDDEEVYSITWKDVALLLQNPVAKSLDIK
ncbi:hypothetical protein Bache_1976 [Bacteroides helcogenes P 36-108]|uniref:Uncharacterized protein n=2 Tax=Bacteroides helcogenes TaxID=290053 RepID=E6SQ95_BACT6|nr:hypothetical protein Bache_1976 [Bacteroides helcogenes P 36-108]